MAKPVIRRTTHQAYFFTEDLSSGIGLDMALIPGGEFMMGSPETEEGHMRRESPQHRVYIPTFFMGCYPITQAQWRAVAAFPEVEQTLEVNPSHFKGDTRPVEQVSWDDAVEFCQRLSRYTGRKYRLPIEEEWEYACRGGTTTPFHFGETVSPELANYNGNDTYGRGQKGEYRQETTPVGDFLPNAFGLYDLHGNVWEWCAHSWHKDYNKLSNNQIIWNSSKVNRGGSWKDSPRYCRSAVRNWIVPNYRKYVLGFRVACSTTLSPATDCKTDAIVPREIDSISTK